MAYQPGSESLRSTSVLCGRKVPHYATFLGLADLLEDAELSGTPLRKALSFSAASICAEKQQPVPLEAPIHHDR